MSEYRLISSDSHIYEPHDLWETRIDPKFRERAPYLAHEEDTDQWYADGNIKFGVVGVNQQAGIRFERPEEIKYEGRYADAPLGGMDPHAHIKDLDIDSVYGDVLYPSMGLTVWRVPDSDLLSAIFRAYNDWLSDFCSPYPNRLKGLAMVNVDNVGEAVRELKRVARLGLVGALIPLRPMEMRYNHPNYEPLWAAAQDLEISLSLHTGTVRWRPNTDFLEEMENDPLIQTNAEAIARESIADMIFSGVFERYPKLRVGAIEFEVAWAPYFIRRMDNVYRERTAGLRGHRYKGNDLPSDFFRRNVFISFQEDELGIQLRHYIGVDNLMWASDYPHAESTFPKSREIVDHILEGIPNDEKLKIAGDNAAKLYRFD